MSAGATLKEPAVLDGRHMLLIQRWRLTARQRQKTNPSRLKTPNTVLVFLETTTAISTRRMSAIKRRCDVEPIVQFSSIKTMEILQKWKRKAEKDVIECDALKQTRYPPHAAKANTADSKRTCEEEMPESEPAQLKQENTPKSDSSK